MFSAKVPFPRQALARVPLLIVAALALLLAACGESDGEPLDFGRGDDVPVQVETDGGIGDGAGPPPVGDPADGDDVADEPPAKEADEPIPVEPDGGIGDGAGPPPFADDEQDAAAGDWHGAQVAETNCPGMDFKRVAASAFAFSVPTTFSDAQPQGIDSEIGEWGEPGIYVAYDYGWYSGPLSSWAGAEVTAIDYSGFPGELVVIPAAMSETGQAMVGVHFGELALDGGEWNALNLMVFHDDPADEIIGRCIVASIDWKIQPAAG